MLVQIRRLFIPCQFVLELIVNVYRTNLKCSCIIVVCLSLKNYITYTLCTHPSTADRVQVNIPPNIFFLCKRLLATFYKLIDGDIGT